MPQPHNAPMNTAMTDIIHHDLPDGRRIAYRLTPGAGPALVFLPGYMSDMAGGKACAVFDWARAQNRACLLLDYSGCGQSSGDFADGTLSRWREEVIALIEALLPDQQVVLIGSSMGGWLMQLVALELGALVAALVGIAAAPDFTDWGLTDEQKAQLDAGHTIYEPNAYGPEPTPTHPGLYRDALQLRLLTRDTLPITCPIRLLHGQADPDVPWQLSLQIAEKAASADVQVILIKDGDHRLSRDSDIALLLNILATLP